MEQLVLIPLVPKTPTPRSDLRRKVVTLMADALLAVALPTQSQLATAPKSTTKGNFHE